MGGKWGRLLTADRIVVGLESGRKRDAIRELAGLLQGNAAIVDFKSLLTDLMRREEDGWTCIGKGVAIPHVHEDTIKTPCLAIGISRQGIEFGAPDGQPIQLIALLVTPKKHQAQHLQLLAALSRLVQVDEVRQRLVKAADAAEVLEIFCGMNK
ncbi:MAG: PTS sugar transporter subunit IIA [Candidatus Handelsmanbacteria bacterium]|nr:PTS sugar transporter subunit IIA [Candidatus Handelsmanbacteria bacterium]